MGVCALFTFLFLSGGILQCINPSVLWRCWLGDRKGIRPVKNWVVGAGMVICLERDADLHMAQLMPRPLTVSCFSKIQIGFTFLVPAHPGSPGQRAFKRVCVCVCSGGSWQGCLMNRMGVSGWMFLLVPADLGSPGQRAVKRLCVFCASHCHCRTNTKNSTNGGFCPHGCSVSCNQLRVVS